MFKYVLFLVFSILFSVVFVAQEVIDSIQKIEEVIIKSQRIALPFKNTSHAISIVTYEELQQTTATSLEEVLQNIQGVDIRRKGIEGMQADLYIRGGNFNQTLLLIDGIKMDDLQTGHHTLNGLVSLENIQRIEIIKGAASRIYGANAMNGAINIVTKKTVDDKTNIKLNIGSFASYGIKANYQKKLGKDHVLLAIHKQSSQGYRYNTDFDNLSIFFKSKFKNYSLLASFGKRDFGANGFYASPKYTDQYEETQTNLVALQTKFTYLQLKITPKIYWRQNQDLFLLVRDNPALYRNKHINNKLGLGVDISTSSNLGQTGMGIDINKGFLVSNNLGNRQRLTSNFFLEHRFQFLHNSMDLTPGVAMTYYSDFGFYTYPGLNIGYKITNNFKLFADVGYTSRVPTFTNMYYTSKIEQGNPNLKPEKALTYEMGIRMNKEKFSVNISLFNRNTTDLIDWVKDDEEAVWQAENIGSVQTNGFEVESQYHFKLLSQKQKIKLAYNYLDESVNNKDYSFSRYTLNSYKHQLIASHTAKLFSFLLESITYSYSQRADKENYHLLDMSIQAKVNQWKLGIKANNIFNTIYSETNLVPMPGFNYMMEVSYQF